MRIAFSADSASGLDAAVHPHFGRCPYFVIVDVDRGTSQSVTSIENPFYDRHEPGQVPQFIHEQGADVMITGGMGGRAVQMFGQLGIDPVTGSEGTVRQALALYLSGKLSGGGSCAESHEHGHGVSG